MAEILACFRPGPRSWLAPILGRRIDRILFAATKADHLHHSQHARLAAIAEALVRDARARAQFSGAETRALSIASLRATVEETVIRDGREVDVVRGRLVDTGDEAALFPGDLPDDPAAILAPARQGAPDWSDAAYRVTRFAPPRLHGRGDGPAAYPPRPRRRVPDRRPPAMSRPPDRDRALRDPRRRAARRSTATPADAPPPPDEALARRGDAAGHPARRPPLARRRAVLDRRSAASLALVVSVAAYDYLTGAPRPLPAARHGRAGADRAPRAPRAGPGRSASSGPSAGSPASTASAPRPPRSHAAADRAAALGALRAGSPASTPAAPSCAGAASGWPSSATTCSTPTRIVELDRAHPARAARRPGPPRDRGGQPHRRRRHRASIPLALRRRAGRAVAERADGPPHRRGLRRARRLLRLLAAARAWSRPTCSPPARSRSATT